MNDAAKKRQRHAFFEALRGNGEIPSGSLEAMIWQASGAVASLAKTADRALAAFVDLPKITDPAYSVDEDRDFDVDLLVRTAQTQRPQTHEKFLKLVGLCLVEAGKMTRYAVVSRSKA